MSTKLSDEHRQFIALLLRSPDTGSGWRRVSTFLASTVRQTVSDLPDLYEIEERPGPEEPGLYVRLSQEGETVAKYV